MRVEARVEVAEEDEEVAEAAEVAVDDSEIVAVAAEEVKALPDHVKESEIEAVPEAVKEELSVAVSNTLKEEEVRVAEAQSEEEEVLVSHEFPCDLVLDSVSVAEAEPASEPMADDSKPDLEELAVSVTNAVSVDVAEIENEPERDIDSFPDKLADAVSEIEGLSVEVACTG